MKDHLLLEKLKTLEGFNDNSERMNPKEFVDTLLHQQFFLKLQKL